MTILGVEFAADPWLALAGIAILIGGFLRGYTGFGSALAIIPPLAMVFGPKAAVAMHAVMEIPVILTLARDAVLQSSRPTVAPMMAALLIATPIGALALTVIDPDAMRLVISALVLAMVAVIAGSDRLSPFIGRRAALGAGAFGGLIQGAAGVGGPPVVLALLARGDDAATARANVVAVMSAMIAVSIITFALFGLVDRTVLIVALVAGPLCLIATWTGRWAFHRSGGRDLKRLALAVIALSAIVSGGGALGAFSPAVE